MRGNRETELTYERLKLDRRTILRHFPKICHAISAKYVLYRKAAKLSAIEQCCREVKLAVTDLYNRDSCPSESRIAKLLTKPGFLRYKEVREVLSQARTDLGIPPHYSAVLSPAVGNMMKSRRP